MSNTAICSTCNGSGVGRSGDPDTSRCRVCRGTGEVDVDAEFDEEIDAECDDDEPFDIDSDDGFNPYTGGPDDDGFDTGDDCFYDE